MISLVASFLLLGGPSTKGVIQPIFGSLPSLTQANRSIVPSRLVLTWSGDPAKSQSATWRTEGSIAKAVGQIAIAKDSPSLEKESKTVEATSESVTVSEGHTVQYHSVEFKGLLPDTLYAYRVGDGKIWSEWAHFRTAASKPKPFTFIYVGDAQNDVKSLWSRAIRGAFQEASRARFILHAGDLINRANTDDEWSEWFEAAGWINAMVPTVATPGNHEYERGTLSKFWRPQFCYPSNGVPGLEESNYTFDFQGVRIVSLNSNRLLSEQAKWLDQVLAKNPNRWTVVTFHHPVFSLAGDRDNDELRKLWQPIFDKYNVDLVLQGHDHTYGRTTRNLRSGVNIREQGVGPVYVVSVSGPKMYSISKPEKEKPMARVAEGIQLYQTVSVDGGKLTYKAFTVTGELYDSFELRKNLKGANQLIDRKPKSPDRRLSK